MDRNLPEIWGLNGLGLGSAYKQRKTWRKYFSYGLGLRPRWLAYGTPGRNITLVHFLSNTTLDTTTW